MNGADSGVPRLSGLRKVSLWTFTLSATIVAVGVLWQAFTIVSYIRGAGGAARDLHVIGAYVTHNLEFIVFLAALVAFWGDWWRVGFSLLLPLYGTIQVFVIGDTDGVGGWVNGLHGLLALVVLLQATWLALDGVSHLSPRWRQSRHRLSRSLSERGDTAEDDVDD